MNPNAVRYLIVVLGISGDLARKKILPTLWGLYNRDLLPADTFVVGFARSNLTVDSLRDKVNPHVTLRNEPERDKYDQFWKNRVHYVRGHNYTTLAEFGQLNQTLSRLESEYTSCNRLFYFALPPHIYVDVAKALRNTSMASKGWTRIVLEKPFGSDLESSNQLSTELGALFREEQLYRMDHYLGKEMVQNILPFRFTNQMYEPIWNRNWIEAVEILFKESFGTYGRGGYFDRFGMIRDVIQNHLLQVFTLVAMEEPVSLLGDEVRDEKVKLLQSVSTLKPENVVLGQYERNEHSAPHEEASRGYLDDATVTVNSTTATYSMTILEIQNERWSGVPFVIRAGKAMDQNQIEVRLYFKTRLNPYEPSDPSPEPGNVLIMRIQPNEAIVQRVRLKQPGTSGFDLLHSTMDLVYSDKFTHADIFDAYERLLLDVLNSNQANFVRTDELEQAWRIFTPVLHLIDQGAIKPHRYKFGASSLPASDKLLARLGLTNLL